MRADWKRIWEIAEQALGIESRARTAFFDNACAGDTELRREAEALFSVFTRTSASPPAAFPTATEVVTEPGPPRARTAPTQLTIGTVIDGKYRIDEVLGSGGMGAVYRATHLQLERAVALKGIRGDLLANRVMAERFRREAIAVARLRHPHIVTIHDYGVAEETGAYIVMELLEGRSLRAELDARKRLALSAALAVFSQAADAVGAAHRMGIIHRDLKPENIFLEHRDGVATVKVVDFGLARLEAAFQSSDANLTNGNEVLGTPGYMSPEQCRGDETDARSDVYALGCVLYELLTGVRPFVGKTIWAVVYKQVNEEPRPPRELVPGIPLEIEQAVLRALAKDPDERYQTPEAFAEALGTPRETVSAPVGATLEDAVQNTGSIQPTVTNPRPPTNLPFAVTRFVGRDREIQDVCGWLSKARLVTLVGPGGIGKTRLALEIASRLLDDFHDGVWLVELAPLSEPAILPDALGAALGVREHAGQSALDAVEHWLRDKSALLVLDNCEHLVEASAALVERLLASCAGLRVLATSRESLAVAGEAVWPVPALALPPASAPDAADCEAVRLFVDRAALAKPGFAMTESVAPAVVELCRRLEGIPLAIELAAARVKALSVAQILDRLGDRFRLLAGGSRTTPSRQQTLRAALDWSHDLLTDDERTLLRRLAVFAGGWTLEAAESVAADPDRSGLAREDVVDLLSRLVDKSLVSAVGEAPEVRYRMLEVVRAYGLERLREADEETTVARRHVDVFRAIAEVMIKTEFIGEGEAERLEHIEAEHDNMRAALGWLLANDPEQCLALAARLADFWSLRGHFAEGLRWMTAAVEASDGAPSVSRVVAIRSIGEYAWRMGDLATARARMEESLQMARVVGNARQIAWSTFHLAVLVQQQGGTRESCELLEECIELAREIDEKRLMGNAFNSLGEAWRIEGDSNAALPFYEQSLAIHRELEHPVGISLTLSNLGAAYCDAGDVEAACRCYLEALPALRELGNAMGMSLALDGLGAVAAKRGEWERAARLAGAAAALRDAIGAELEPADRTLRERYMGRVRERLDAGRLEAALAEGRAAARDRALDEALSM